jgi:hypothetical protein
MRRSFLAISAAILTLTLVSGCASTSGTTGPTGGPTTAPSDTPTLVPTAAQTPTFVPQAFTCNTILPPTTLTIFTSKAKQGFKLQPDFLSRMKNIGSNLVHFVDFGGILCQWSYPDTQPAINYGYSPITFDQASAERTALATNGYVESTDQYGIRVSNPDKTNFPDNYLFIDGYWFYASDSQFLDLMIQNLFTPTAQ